jgi:hypothetical protein
MLLFSKSTLTWIGFLIAAGFVTVVLQWKKQTHRVLAMSTMALSTGTFVYASRGLVHAEHLRQRANSDYGYEGLGWLLASIAVISGLNWARKWFQIGSVMLTLASAWLFLIFFMMVSTI